MQGSHVTELQWTRTDKNAPFPWELAISENAPQIGTLLTMHSTPHHKCTFVVNATPVLGADGKPRGAMATFDDVTSIEEKNLQLEEMLQALKTSFEDVRQKNKELKLLAARDPLTGCLNRRSLFDAFVIEWQTAAAQGTVPQLPDGGRRSFQTGERRVRPCGWGRGASQTWPAALLEGVRDTDFVGRYGGEEFCLLLPRTSLQAAAAIAEKLRLPHRRGLHQPQSDGQFRRLLDGDTAPPSAGTAGRGRSGDVSFEENRPQSRHRLVGTRSPTRPKLTKRKSTSARTPRRFTRAFPCNRSTRLMSALVFRDPITAEHSRRVADLCVLAARGQMSEEQCYIFEVAGLLHDMGKLGMPDSILLKPGPLTNEERRIMSTHDRIGVEILRDAFSSKELSDIVANSHAWYTRQPP